MAEVRSHLADVIDRARRDGTPTIITRRGKREAVVIDIDEYQRLRRIAEDAEDAWLNKLADEAESEGTEGSVSSKRWLPRSVPTRADRAWATSLASRRMPSGTCSRSRARTPCGFCTASRNSRRRWTPGMSRVRHQGSPRAQRPLAVEDRRLPGRLHHRGRTAGRVGPGRWQSSQRLPQRSVGRVPESVDIRLGMGSL